MSNQIQHKMQSFAEAPPPMAWLAIAERLDEQKNSEEQFGKKMYESSITPPSGIWNKIEERLLTQNVKVVTVPKTGKVIGIWKYAAAACVACIAAASIWMATNDKSPDVIVVNKPDQTLSQPTTNNPLADPATKSPAGNGVATVIPNNKETTVSNTSSATTTQKVKAAQNDVQSAFIPVTQQPDAQDIAAINPLDNGLTPIVNSDGQAEENIDNNSNTNRYVSIIGPNGESIRVSSKFSKQLGLFGGSSEEGIDVIIKESAKWRNTITKWRKLMNNAKVSPSFENFMDINALGKLLDQ